MILYSRNVRLYKSYGFPDLDSKHLAWHTSNTPQIPINPLQAYKTAHMLPDYDTITCRHCSQDIRIPLAHPRMNPQSLRLYDSAIYLPLAPQRCMCDNLGLLVSASGLLKVYLKDRDAESFSITNGLLDLHKHDSSALKEPIDLPMLLKQKATSPFSKTAKQSMKVNHVNLYKVEETTQNILLPYSSPQEYSRTYNIVILGALGVYFPTGHFYAYSKLKGIFHKPIGQLLGIPEQTTTADALFKKAVPTDIALRNAFVSYLYHTHLPTVLTGIIEARNKYLSTRLKIPRYNPPKGSLQPFMLAAKHPLTLYKEIGIYTLTKWVIRTPNTHLQDFTDKPQKIPKALEGNKTLSEYLMNQLFTKRRHLVEYTKSRRHIDPQSILRYAIDYLKLPPVTPITLNETLLHLSEPL